LKEKEVHLLIAKIEVEHQVKGEKKKLFTYHWLKRGKKETLKEKSGAREKEEGTLPFYLEKGGSAISLRGIAKVRFGREEKPVSNPTKKKNTIPTVNVGR